MSHTVKVEAKVKKPYLLERVAETRGWTILSKRKHRLFSESVEGVGIQFPDWNYPVIITDEGEVKYDNYNGNWGKQETLDDMMQQYTVEAAREQAQLHGYTVDELHLDDGSIQLTLNDYSE